MKTLKTVLVWIGVNCANLRLKLGVDLIDWVFSLSPNLRSS
jgi:hypothetical protein